MWVGPGRPPQNDEAAMHLHGPDILRQFDLVSLLSEVAVGLEVKRSRLGLLGEQLTQLLF